MTRDEFERELRRVLVAFGVEAASQGALDIYHHTQTHYHVGAPMKDAPVEIYALELEDESFRLWVSGRFSREEDSFFIHLTEPKDRDWQREFISFVRNSAQLCLECPKGPTRYDALMVRGLFYLGYDIEPLCEQAGIDISAHQRLEWALERPQSLSA